jgi:UDP-GlcNAc3NAcA epimerase
MSKKILTILGARPQFIKASAFSSLISKNSAIIEEIIHTGQHYDENMSAVFFSELGIPKPKYFLEVGSHTHGVQTAHMLEKIEHIMLDEKPDLTVVYGDTNSTLAGALAAAKLHIPIAHVEAGLRSFNKKMPEEINRVLTDHVSSLLFAPTKTAASNLFSEGIDAKLIHVVGDVMFDVALFQANQALKYSNILQKYNLDTGDYILATIHRAENTNNPNIMASIVNALQLIGIQHKLIMPLHPRTRGILSKLGLWESLEKSVRFIPPVSYLDMVMLEKNAKLIVTDSGGVQKEAFFYNVPCVTIRTETEWVELVELGWNVLVNPSDSEQIVNTVELSIGSKGKLEFPYGHGTAANEILAIISRYLSR